MTEAATQESRQVRNYVYGLLPPTEGAELVAAELSAAHRYYNTLIELERKRRAEYRELLSRHPDVARLEVETAGIAEQADAIFDRVAKESAQLRRKVPLSPSEKAQLRELKQLLAAKRAELKAAKERLKGDADLQRAIAAASAAHNERLKAAYNATALYWGSRLSTVEAFEAAIKLTKGDPHFRRWDGRGRLSVQCQGGLATDDVFDAANTRVRLEPVDVDRAYTRRGPESAAGHGRRPAQRTRLHLRVGSDQGRPVWAVFPCILHRPLPPGSIKWVHLIRDRVADREQWRVCFIIESPSTQAAPTAPRPGVVSVSVGWQKKDDGRIRVAFLRDDAGNTEELTLPARMWRTEERLREIASLRALAFNEAKSQLQQWWQATGTELSGKGGCAVDMAAVAGWKSPAQIVVLLKHNGDKLPEPLKNTLTNFVARDLRRWRATEARRGRVRRQRDAMHDEWARRLASRYGTIVVEKTRLSELIEQPARGLRPSVEVSVRNRQRAFAALHSFVGAMKKRSLVLEVAAEDAARTCAACEHVNASHDADTTRCAACGAPWDIGANAAAATLSRSLAAIREQPTEQITQRRTKSDRVLRFAEGRARKHAAAADKTE